MEMIEFNKKIYKLEAIKKAAEEFKNLANIRIKETGGYIKVTFDKIDSEYKEVLKDEFTNFVLGMLS